MSFLKNVIRARTYLSAQGRVSLRALGREFGLAGDELEELAAELVDVQGVATRDGEILSWAGSEGAEIQGSPSEAPGPTFAGHGEAAPARNAAERRQLSVLFCDLEGSTSLAAAMDPEDWREIVREYQTEAEAIVARYDGTIAQYLGDGLLVYFGWPRAHEDDAERAVRAGLGIVEAIGMNNEALAARHSIELGVRVGIDTGPVVVGEMGAGGNRETLAMGDTPNVAAHIQSAAARNTVLLSSATLRLVSGVFVVENMGERVLKGARAVHLHRAIRPTGMRSRLDLTAEGERTPLIGRGQELGMLEDRFEQVREGLGQAVLISGEPGIGKSRLVQAFRERIAERPHTWLEGYSSPYRGDSALYPVLELQRRGLDLGPDLPNQTRVERLEAALVRSGFDPEEALPLMAAFHGLPLGDRDEGRTGSPAARRAKTLALLVEWLLRLGRVQPLILLIEDLHWVDPSTLELLEQVLEQIPRERVLVIATCRPDFDPPWSGSSHLTPIRLRRLSQGQLGGLVRGTAHGRELPEAWVEEILGRSDGVPLYAEELTRAAVDSHREPDRSAAPAALPVPESLQDLLAARLDALGPAKELALVGSVLGREFSYGLLRAVSPMREAELQSALRSAVREELLHRRGAPPDATYLFRHALLRDAAYGSLLRTRRAELHAATAEALAERFPEVAEAEPELVAHHRTLAGQAREAVDLWRGAAGRSLRRSANREAVGHLRRALDLLDTLPASPERDREELDLQIQLGTATMMIEGWGSPEVARLYARARELSPSVSDERERFPILWGFWMIHMMRGEVQEWREIAAELLEVAERHADTAMLIQAHHAGWGNPGLGDFASQLAHTERGLSYYAPAKHSRLATRYGGHDAGVCGHVHRGVALWAMGFPDQSRQSFAAALQLADEIGHPQSKAHALAVTCWLPAFQSNWPETLRAADEGNALASKLAIPTFLSMTHVVRGWARVGLGEASEGLAEMARGLELAAVVPGVLATQNAFLAEALHLAGDDDALETVRNALRSMERSGEHLWKANSIALEGDLLLASGHPGDAEGRYHAAIEFARAQSATMWELRAATRLACLWHSQDRTAAARDLLAPIHDKLTEGFDTTDVMAASELLRELS